MYVTLRSIWYKKVYVLIRRCLTRGWRVPEWEHGLWRGDAGHRLLAAVVDPPRDERRASVTRDAGAQVAGGAGGAQQAPADD